jgi:transcriptional regulator with XRE-family HTH domain
MESFGQYIRKVREDIGLLNKDYSLRKVSARLLVEPSYLSKIERDLEKPSEDLIIKIANEYDLNIDSLLAMNGKVSKELQSIILKNPQLFSELLISLKNSPNHAILRIVREVKDGNW